MMKRPRYLIVVGHDKPVYPDKIYLGSLPKNEGLLLCIYSSTKGKDIPPRINKRKFREVKMYNFNEFDPAWFQKKRDDSWRDSGPFFEEKMAHQIFDDVEENMPYCNGLISSCNAGLSRSLIIANFFNDYYGWRFKDWFTHRKNNFRNEFIYRVMKKVGKER